MFIFRASPRRLAETGAGTQVVYTNHASLSLKYKSLLLTVSQYKHGLYLGPDY